MNTYKVRDDENLTEDDADEIEAWDPELAACEYAEHDVDGHCDGLYSGGSGSNTVGNLQNEGHAIAVRDQHGVLTKWKVGIVELEPVYGAVPMLADGEVSNG